jgi:hypothetical protein
VFGALCRLLYLFFLHIPNKKHHAVREKDSVGKEDEKKQAVGSSNCDQKACTKPQIGGRASVFPAQKRCTRQSQKPKAACVGKTFTRKQEILVEVHTLQRAHCVFNQGCSITLD